MRNLTLLDVDNIDLWERIVSNKNLAPRHKLLAIKSKVQERYQLYLTNNCNLAIIKPSEDFAITSNKDDLISCYGNNVNFNPVKKRLLSLSHKCPYCCINRPNTIDHYFDKSKYPEYSVFVPNLVPCCSDCNETKSTYVFNKSGERIFLHFYYDSIPEYQFIFVRFMIDSDGVPVFSIYLEFEEQTESTDIIERHFSKLSILDKYKECVKDKLPVLLTQIDGYKKKMPANAIREILTTQYESLLEHNGANYWETCIYEGVINSPEFLDKYLKQSKTVTAS